MSWPAEGPEPTAPPGAPVPGGAPWPVPAPGAGAGAEGPRPPLPPPLPFPGPPPPGPRWGMGDVWIGLGLYLAAQVVVGLLLVAILVATGNLDAGASQDQLNDDIGLWAVAIGVPIGWVVLFGWPWWVSRTKGTRSMARDLGLAWRPMDLLIGVGGGVAALVVGAVAAGAFVVAFDRDAPTNTDIIPSEDVTAGVAALLLVVVALGTPIAEEVFFRGLVLGAARRRWGTAVGIVVSSAIFGLAHVQDSLEGWAFVGVVTGSYGALFAGLRVLTQGRLAAPIVAHVVVNATGVLLVLAGVE